MFQPRDRFGEIGGHFYEKGMGRTASRRRQRIAIKRRSYVRKARPAPKKKRREVSGFLLAAMIFSLLGLAFVLDGALDPGPSGKPKPEDILPAMWFIIMGSSFLVLHQQNGKKKGAKPEQ